jgi:STE24 endopeptidase
VSARRTIGLAAAGVLAVAWVVALVRLWPGTVPGGLRLGHVADDEVLRGAALDRARRFSHGQAVLALAGQLVVLAVLFLYARRGAALMRESAAGPIGTGILLGMLGLALVWLAGLPIRVLDLWWTKHYGLVRTDWVTFLLGDYFALGGQFLAASLQLAIVMGLARLLKRGWPFAAVPLVVAIQLGLVLALPWLLSGLEPLHDPALRTDARRLAATEQVHPVTVRVQEVHEETSAPNAEAVGRVGGGGHVIVWDTLLRGGFSRKEIGVVIAHELGHLRHRDTLRLLGFVALMLLPLALIAERATRARGGLARPEAVPLALLVVALFGLATQPLQAAFSRGVEAAADWTALQSTRDPAAAERMFSRLGERTLSEPSSPFWAHALYQDHPDIADRVAMARAWAARENRR